MLHFLVYAKRDMFGGVAFGGFEIAVHEFGPRQGKLHIERYRAGNLPMKAFESARGSRTPNTTAKPRIWFSKVTRWPTSFLRAMINERSA